MKGASLGARVSLAVFAVRDCARFGTPDRRVTLRGRVVALFTAFAIAGVAFGTVIAGLWSPSVAAAEAEVSSGPAFEWNVLLDQWQVIGPFPRPTKTKSCLEVDFLGGEPQVMLDKPVTWKGKRYQWTTWAEPVVDFRRALLVGDEADYHVAYAYTEFASPKRQQAVLALGHDDGARVWLNGEQIYQHVLGTSAYLDQAAVEVTLKKGTNTLLMKVTQRWGAWAALARLRPPGLDKPLVTFGCDYRPGGGTLRLPTLRLDLLDANGSVLETLYASGYRVKAPPRILFTCYATPPEPEPARVRIRCRHPALGDYDRTIGWTEAREGTFQIAVKAVSPLSGRLVDAQTGKPISGAQFKVSQRTYCDRSDASGRFTLAEYSPLEPTFWAAAAGYQPKQVLVDVPEHGELVIALRPGAQVLRGTITDEDGQPIRGATVNPRLYRGWTPQAVTDANGHFEIVGIPADTKQLYPTAVHPDYVAKDGFSLSLDSDKVTEVRWTLKRGAVVTGRVTAKADRRPLEGILVTAGFDRFVSNRVNPEAQTDADGRYRLTGIAPGEALIHAFSDRFAPSMQRVEAKVGQPVQLDFQLQRGKPVTGRVTDPSGKPIEDVWIITDTWEGVRMFRREAHTDRDGRFTLPHMPATPVETHVLERGYVSVRDLMIVGGKHYDVTLKPVVTHRVRLRLADTNKPPEKIEVHKGYLLPGRDQVFWDRRTYLERNYNAQTGIYEIKESEPSTAKRFLRFRVPGYRDAKLEIPTDATESKTFQFVLEKLGVIRGRVVSAQEGKPLDGIMVALVNKQDRIRMDHYVQFDAGFQTLRSFTGIQALTGPDGSFELPQFDADANYDILLIKRKAGFHYIPNARAMFAQSPIELPYPQPGVVEGTVLVAGKPSANESVYIDWIPNVGTERQWEHPFGIGGIVKADANGRFCFEGLGPGRYRLCRVREFSAPGMGGMSCFLSGDEIVLEPGQTLRHDLVQPAGCTVTGRTVDPEGKPLGGCIVSAMRRGLKYERLDAVRCDSEGRFTVFHLPAGPLEFSADHYARKTGSTCGLGDEDYRGRITVDVSEAAQVTIRMKPAAQGRLTAAKLTGTIPPDFTAPIFGSDETFSLSDHWGKVVALDFWATWCGPCMAAMPEIKKLYEQYKDRDDVVLVTVSLDTDQARLRKVIEEKGLEFPVLFSGRGWQDAVARAFGVRAIPSSFVIGRDGRFATEMVHGAQLASAIKTALDKPLNPAFAGKKPARLTVKVCLDEQRLGLPGVKLLLKATDRTGKTVHQEELTMPGQATRLVWLYPQLAPGGTVAVTARAEGMKEQTQKVKNPGAKAAVAFVFTSPRHLAGRLAADEGKTPAPGLKITARRDDGFSRSAATDEQGRFSIAVLPGSYTLAVQGSERFFPAIEEPVTMVVPADADPQPLELRACRTTALRGVVRDAAGQPVAGAEVFFTSRLKPVKTDDQGRFLLPGVPSLGKFTVYARGENKFARVELEGPNSKREVEIIAGESSASPGALRPGQNLPPLTAWSLDDGKPVHWKPGGRRKTLVVFCSLWHPGGRQLLRRAVAWVKDKDTELAAFSTDWCPEQARRRLKGLALNVPVLFAGPGGLAASANWRFALPAQAFLVGPQGKVLSVPIAMELP